LKRLSDLKPTRVVAYEELLFELSMVVQCYRGTQWLVRVLLPDASFELVDAGLTDDQLAARLGADEVIHSPRIEGIPFKGD
jgi:predicted ester cyclase